MNYAIDREAIVKILGGELQAAPSSGILADTMLPEGFDGGGLPVDARRRRRRRRCWQEAGVKTPMDAGTMYYPEAGVNADIAQQIAVRPQERSGST